jgi:hypothetical protein
VNFWRNKTAGETFTPHNPVDASMLSAFQKALDCLDCTDSTESTQENENERLQTQHISTGRSTSGGSYIGSLPIVPLPHRSFFDDLTAWKDQTLSEFLGNAVETALHGAGDTQQNNSSSNDSNSNKKQNKNNDDVAAGFKLRLSTSRLVRRLLAPDSEHVNSSFHSWIQWELVPVPVPEPVGLTASKVEVSSHKTPHT